jgi:hypothetical protein
MRSKILNFLQFLPSVWRCAADERIHYRNRGMPESGVFVVVGLLVLAIRVAVILPYAQAAAAAAAEGFESSGIDEIQALRNNRAAYVSTGQSRYNKFSDTNDVTAGNFLATADDYRIKQGDMDIAAATATAGLAPEDQAPTKLGIDPQETDYAIAPASGLLRDAKRCEAVRGRSACSALGSNGMKNCGVCIKGGTAYTRPNDPGKHIGGLVITPDDVEGTAPDYKPSVGSCPPGFFFVDKAACEVAANREGCKEVGLSGGFNGGRTIEGDAIADAKCAQAVGEGRDVYLYDSKNRTFPVRLRGVAPTGTGITEVRVVNKSSGVASSMKNVNAGQEFVLTLSGVKEGDEFSIEVVEEVPYRPGGKPEIFQYKFNSEGSGKNIGYSFTEEGAKANCERIGAKQATRAQLEEALILGAQACSTGWAQGLIGWPMQARYNDGDPTHDSWCGRGGIINEWGFTTKRDGKEVKLGHSWCYGVKPPQSINQKYYNEVVDWFVSLGKNALPSQEEKPTIRSMHGADYQAPAYRAICFQWESLDGVKTYPFKNTVTAVNGMGAEADGTIKILRDFGTFKESAVIKSPRPSSAARMNPAARWLWSNQAISQVATFTAFVPGTFLPPSYPADATRNRFAPLITTKKVFDKLKMSPCAEAGQRAGAYSADCLRTLFRSAGGDPVNGKLAADITKLNAYGGEDAITGYLTGLYRIATTGKTEGGMKLSATEINDAAQKLFGMDIVSPCEDISEDAQGRIVLTPKVGGLDAECLDHLWMNTGSDADRGSEESRRSSLSNTYTTIGDRFSGLRRREGSAKERAAAPFTTCKRSGSMAPVSAKGVPNWTAINIANAKGSLGAVQNFYDGIHKAANYTGGSKDDAVAHDKAVEQCYGIKRAGGASTLTPPTAACDKPLPRDFVPVKNTIIGRAKVSADYRLTFDITPLAVQPDWANIIHFTTGEDIREFGSRTPGVWFVPGGLGLHIKVGDLHDTNFGFDNLPGCAIGKQSRVVIECRGSSITVTIDGARYNLKQPYRRFAGETTVYGSDPWYMEAKARVNNMSYAAL